MEKEKSLDRLREKYSKVMKRLEQSIFRAYYLPADVSDLTTDEPVGPQVRFYRQHPSLKVSLAQKHEWEALMKRRLLESLQLLKEPNLSYGA